MGTSWPHQGPGDGLCLTVLEVEQTSLTDVLDLGACLADLSLLVSHLRSGTPLEDCEWALADL